MDHGPLSLWPQASSLGSSLGALELKIHHCIPSLQTVLGFPGGAIGKEPACQCSEIRDMGLIPGLGRSPGGGHGNLLQYSCLENPMDGGAWQATVHKAAQSQTQLKRLSMHVH